LSGSGEAGGGAGGRCVRGGGAGGLALVIYTLATFQLNASFYIPLLSGVQGVLISTLTLQRAASWSIFSQ